MDMESRNPIIRRAEKNYSENSGPGFASVNNGSAAAGAAGAASANQQYAQPAGAPPASPQQLRDMYNQPSVAGARGISMTLNDVIMKTALNFVILVIAAAASWVYVDGTSTVTTNPITGVETVSVSGTAIGLMVGAMLIGFVLAMVNIFKREISPILVIAYALVEGVFLGVISYIYQGYGQQNGYGNLVATAVIATLVVFAVMLTLYVTRVIKVTNKFKKIFMVAIISYAAFAIISLIAGMFGVGDGWGFFGAGPLGIVFSVIVVGIAAFALCLDFDAIEQSISYGVPERESWRMAFGLMVTIIWLYMEILRLLALVSRN